MIKNILNKLLALLCAAAVAAGIAPTVFAASESETAAVSPDGNVSAYIDVSGGQILYTVRYGDKTVLDGARIGITFENADFSTGAEIVGIRENVIDETYPMLTGKAANYVNRANETVVTLAKDGRMLDIYIRAYDDGAAYRYGFYEDTRVYSETGEYDFPAGSTAFAMEYEKCYENFYNRHALSELSGVYGMPMTFDLGGSYALISEANLNGSYAGSALNASGGRLSLSFEPKQTEPVSVASGSFSPWRMIVVGDLNTIATTQMPENLSDPSKIADTSWIQPGVSSWTWFNGDPTNDPDVYKEYIDFSSEMGWQYVLLDEGWQPMEYDEQGRRSYSGLNDWTAEVIDYANARGIGVIVWAASWDLDTPEKRERLAEWSAMGIKGVKVDFFDSETQETLKLMDEITLKAAENRLLVNYHGCTKPSGERRTWPNLITREAVYGNEHFLSGEGWGPTAEHNCTLIFTRNAVGPMDYTPELTNYYGKNYFSDGQKAALTIAFESGIQCLSDKPEVYRNSVLYNFLKNLPTTWDETRILDGSIGDYAVVMRRKGSDYYIGSICNAQRSVDLSLDFLGEGKYWLEMYADGRSDTEALKYTALVDKADIITLPQLEHGGAVVKFTPYQYGDAGILDAGGHWCEANIRSLAADGRLNIYFYGDFEPDENITRAEFVMLLCDAFGFEYNVGVAKFEDIKASVAKNYINEATDRGIINGVSATEFEPFSEITREDAAVILGRYLELKGGINSGFTDSANISDYAKEYVAQCSARGIVNGYEDGSFRPKNSITRAEAAAMIERCVGLK